MIIETMSQLSKSGLKTINIDGANTYIDNASFNSLIQHWAKKLPEQKREVAKLEALTEQIYDEARSYTPTTMQVRADKVVIPDGTIIHSSNGVTRGPDGKPVITDSLKSIAISGILASEWFGAMESENECAFCASAAIYRRDTKELSQGRLREQLHRRGDNSVCFYFDTNNPIMQRLIKLDYYEYARMKKEEPENIKKKYSPEEIQILENLILPYSRGGQHYHYQESHDQKNYDWLAFPGGIPPQLINGISIGHKNHAIDLVYEIANLFPNATIFGEDGFVLAYPKSKETNEVVRKSEIKGRVAIFKAQKQLEEKTASLKDTFNIIKNGREKISNATNKYKNTKFGKYLDESYKKINEILDKKLQELQSEIVEVSSQNSKTKLEELNKNIAILDLQLSYFEQVKKCVGMVSVAVDNYQYSISKPAGQISPSFIEFSKRNLVQIQKQIDDYISKNKPTTPPTKI